MVAIYPKHQRDCVPQLCVTSDGMCKDLKGKRPSSLCSLLPLALFRSRGKAQPLRSFLGFWRERTVEKGSLFVLCSREHRTKLATRAQIKLDGLPFQSRRFRSPPSAPVDLSCRKMVGLLKGHDRMDAMQTLVCGNQRRG